MPNRRCSNLREVPAGALVLWKVCGRGATALPARGCVWYNFTVSLRSEDEARRKPECRIQGIVARQVPRVDLRLYVKCSILKTE